MSTLLIPEWPGDVTCPYCEQELRWSGNLPDNTFERVFCHTCGETFFCKRVVQRVTYITKKEK